MPIIVTSDFPPMRGGIQRMMAQLAAALVALGGDVAVVTGEMPESAEFDRTVPYAIARYADRGRGFATLAGMFLTYVRVLRRTKHRTTLVAVFGLPALVVALLPRFVRGRFFIFAHGAEIAPSRRGARMQVMRFVFRRAQAVIANSRFTEGLLADAGVRGNVTRVSLAVDDDPISPGRSNRPTILSVGRLIERKGFDLTLDAVATLVEQIPTLCYQLVGDGPQRAALEARSRELGLTDHVEFRGKLTDVELRAAYANAWVFAMPARRICDDVEGFGLVYLEAAMAELPSIGGRDSGASDAIVDGETGYLVDGTDANAIASALLRLLTDADHRTELGTRARERAAGFTWQRTAREVRAIYQG